MVNYRMDLFYYYDLFLKYETLKDDNRLRLVNSNEQKLIYSFARRNGFITTKIINKIYSTEKSILKILKKFVALEILKKINEIDFEYIKLKQHQNNNKDNGEL